MIRNKINLFILLILIPSLKVSSNEYAILIGPSVHYNFGFKTNWFSLNIESSYWDLNDLSYGYGGGIEFEKEKFRVYTEFNVGMILGATAGASISSTYNFDSINFGIQNGIWAAYWGGLDLKLRAEKDASSISPGVFLKLPVKIRANL